MRKYLKTKLMKNQLQLVESHVKETLGTIMNPKKVCIENIIGMPKKLPRNGIVILPIHQTINTNISTCNQSNNNKRNYAIETLAIKSKSFS